MAATLDALRDEDVRVVALDTAGMAEEAWEVAGAAALGMAVLPVVAAWTGSPGEAAIAAGLFADIRVGDPSLRLALEQLDGAGEAVTRRLEVLAGGISRAKRLTARDALTAGLIGVVAEKDGGALAEAVRIAEAIAERGPIATQLAKEATWRGLAMPLEQAMRFETDLTLLLQTTKDRAEGVRAFLEKRLPEFEGE